jgi:hypothetical protein
MFSWFKSTPKPTLADNPHFTLRKKTQRITFYNWKNAPVFTTKIAKKNVSHYTTTRTEVIGKSETTLLGVLPLTSTEQTREIAETTATTKYRLVQTPLMIEIAAQISEQLKDKEVLSGFVLMNKLTPQQEADELRVIPVVEDFNGSTRYAITWVLAPEPAASSSEDPTVSV